MLRYAVVVLAGLITGCTVGWTELRTEQTAPKGWACPGSLKLDVVSGYGTNTFGPKETKPEIVRERETQYRAAAEQVLSERRCVPDGSGGDTLQIKVEEMQQLSALPQEWLTGLSLGLIPSWGTRPAEIRFTFLQGSRTATYLVDDKRVNHLVLFPVFWLSFFLVDNEAEFEKALRDFTTGL
jgi:hypothetical protein